MNNPARFAGSKKFDPSFLKRPSGLTAEAAFLRAVAVWSFRKLVSDYSGYCIQLSDGATDIDIGWLPVDDNGVVWVDGYAMGDAIAGGHTSVKVWYDQSVNGIDLTQRSFSTSTNPILIDINATPINTPAILFGKVAVGSNALHDNSNDPLLDDIFAGGGMFGYTGHFDADATTGSYIWSKGTANYLKFNSTTSVQLGDDRATTDGRFTKTSHHTEGGWFSGVVDYDNGSTSGVPFFTVNDSARAIASVATAPVGDHSTDAANKFTLGNRQPGSFGCMSGYLSEFIVWSQIL